MAFIRNVDKLIEGLENKFFTEARAKAALAPELAAEESARLAGDSAEAAARQAADNALDARLDVIEGSGEGSVAKAEQDAKDYADQKVAALVNSAPEVLDTLKELSDALGSDPNFATTVANNIGQVDDKVDQEILDRQSAVSAEQSARESADQALDGRLDLLEADSVTKAYVDSQDSSLSLRINQEVDDRQQAISDEEDARELADSNLSSRISVLEQDPTTKAYVDGEVSDLQGQITQEISDRQAGVSAEESRALAAEGLLDGRLDVLEQDPTTKSYVDGEVSDLQGQITQEISDRQIDVEAEEQRAISAESALDARLDIIEGLDSVEGSIAKAEKDAKDYADSLDSAMDARVDVLEQDPTTKTYVDGVKSNLQGQINQEKDDRQAGDNALDGRLDVLEQDPTTKTYVDGIQSALDSRLDVLESDPVTKSYVDGEVSNLQGQVNTEKGRIDAILSAADADKDSFAEIVQLINSVDTSNDNAFASYVLSNDAALAQEISDRQADVNAEEQRALTAEGLLDGRLDVLETDPTTKSYVDSGLALKVDVTPNYDIRPSVYNIGSKSANFAINFANGPMQKVTLSASVTVTFQNPVSGGNYLIEVVQDATGSRQITWPTVQWFNDAPPTLSGSNKIDFVQLFYDGSNYYGSYQLADVTFAKSSELNSSVSSLQASISAETAARIAADNSEASSRSSADTTLQNNINSEASTRAAEDLLMFKKDGSRVMTGAMDMGNYGINNIGDINMLGGQKVKYSAKAVNYTLVAGDYVIAVSDLSVSRIMTLPSASSMGAGKTFIIKDQSGAASQSNYVQIAPQAGQLIDGQSDYKIVMPYESVMLVSNGTHWFII